VPRDAQKLVGFHIFHSENLVKICSQLFELSWTQTQTYRNTNSEENVTLLAVHQQQMSLLKNSPFQWSIYATQLPKTYQKRQMTAGSRRSAKREPAVFLSIKCLAGARLSWDDRPGRRPTLRIYITYNGMHFYRAAINDKRRPDAVDGNRRQYSILHGHWEKWLHVYARITTVNMTASKLEASIDNLLRSSNSKLTSAGPSVTYSLNILKYSVTQQSAVKVRRPNFSQYG